MKTTIDPEVFKILSESFICTELAKHPAVMSVRLNRLLYERRRFWAWWDPDPDCREILLDSTVSPATICAFANKTFPGLDLTEREAWYFVLFHEGRHADGVESEWDCDYYAKERLLQWRKEEEAESQKFYITIKNVAAEAMREGIRVAFRGSYD